MCPYIHVTFPPLNNCEYEYVFETPLFTPSFKNRDSSILHHIITNCRRKYMFYWTIDTDIIVRVC